MAEFRVLETQTVILGALRQPKSTLPRLIAERYLDLAQTALP
jgi:hypothetical protein